MERACYDAIGMWPHPYRLRSKLHHLDFEHRLNMIKLATCTSSRYGVGKPQPNYVDVGIKVQLFDS